MSDAVAYRRELSLRPLLQEVLMSRPVLTYVFDAYCGWCYGFGPAFAALVEHVGDRAEIRVVNGGLFIDDRAQPIGNFGHIPKANARIAQLTGVTFGPAYEQVLRDGTLVMDSLDAAAGFNALRNAAPEREAELASAVQRAWYRDGRSLSEPATYAAIAHDLGLDGDAVAADAASQSARDQARREFATTAQLGVHEYPTLLLSVDGVTRRLGGPVSKPEQLIGQFDSALAAAA